MKVGPKGSRVELLANLQCLFQREKVSCDSEIKRSNDEIECSTCADERKRARGT